MKQGTLWNIIVQYIFNCAFKHCRTNLFIFSLAIPNFFSSQSLPTWAWGSVYTWGASGRVWVNTITRLLTKPTRKEITATRQNRQRRLIASTRSSQKSSFTLRFQNRKWFLHGFDTPGYFEHLFFLTWESLERWMQTSVFVRYKPVCLLSAPFKRLLVI